MRTKFTVELKNVDIKDSTNIMCERDFKNDIKAKLWAEMIVRVLRSLLPECRFFYDIKQIREQ